MTPLKTEAESVVWDYTKNFYPVSFWQIDSSFMHQSRESWWCKRILSQLNFNGIFFPASLVVNLSYVTHKSWSLNNKPNFEHKAVPLTSVTLAVTGLSLDELLVSVIWCDMLKSSYKMLINVRYFSALWLNCFLKASMVVVELLNTDSF